MSRPKGSKNKVQRPRTQALIVRLTIAERAVMLVAADTVGLDVQEWARQGLRRLAGLPALAPIDAKTSPF